MYRTRGALPVDSLSPGTRLLAVGPPVLDVRSVAYRLLASGLSDGEGAVLVTVDRGADRAGRGIGDRLDDESALEHLAVVDATGGTEPRPGSSRRYAVESVSSPADLTGIGLSLTRALEALDDRGIDRVRLAVDSLSSLVVYADVEPVYRFAHAIGVRVEEVGGVGVFLLNGDTDRDATARFGSVADGTLELRDGDDGPEWRLRGIGADQGWTTADLDDEKGTPAGSGDEDSAEDRAPTEEVHNRGRPERPVDLDVSTPGSLYDLIERVENSRYTLTLCNHPDDETVPELQDYFDGLGVTVRTADLSTPDPSGVAVLHRGSEPLAMSPVEELLDAVRFDDAPETTTPSAVRPEVLERANRQQYTVENGGKLRMVRISRLVETRALDLGRGTLHAGFQRLGRVQDELGTRQLYERIAATDVDVHVYGRPGPVPNPEQYTIHEGESDELADSWFVVFDGAGRDDAVGALVSKETGPDRYSGFWTYRPSVVRAADDYLRSTYLATAD